MIYTGLLSKCSTAACYYFPAEHIESVFSFATRLYSWLLNPVGGEEHGRERDDAHHVGKSTTSQFPTWSWTLSSRNTKQPRKCRRSARKLHNYYYFFHRLRTKRVSQGIKAEVSGAVKSPAWAYMEQWAGIYLKTSTSARGLLQNFDTWGRLRR